MSVCPYLYGKLWFFSCTFKIEIAVSMMSYQWASSIELATKKHLNVNLKLRSYVFFMTIILILLDKLITAMSYQIYCPQEQKESLLYLLEHVSIQVNNIWTVDYNCVSWEGRGVSRWNQIKMFSKAKCCCTSKIIFIFKIKWNK